MDVSGFFDNGLLNIDPTMRPFFDLGDSGLSESMMGGDGVGDGGALGGFGGKFMPMPDGPYPLMYLDDQNRAVVGMFDQPQGQYTNSNIANDSATTGLMTGATSSMNQQRPLATLPTSPPSLVMGTTPGGTPDSSASASRSSRKSTRSSKSVSISGEDPMDGAGEEGPTKKRKARRKSSSGSGSGSGSNGNSNGDSNGNSNGDSNGNSNKTNNHEHSHSHSHIHDNSGDAIANEGFGAEGDGGDNDDEDQDQYLDPKRNVVLARNRVAALKCRKKKKEFVSDLEEQRADLEHKHQRLQAEYTTLLSEVTTIKNQLMDHAGCNDPHIDNWLDLEARRFVQNTKARYSRAYGNTDRLTYEELIKTAGTGPLVGSASGSPTHRNSVCEEQPAVAVSSSVRRNSKTACSQAGAPAAAPATAAIVEPAALETQLTPPVEWVNPLDLTACPAQLSAQMSPVMPDFDLSLTGDIDGDGDHAFRGSMPPDDAGF